VAGQTSSRSRGGEPSLPDAVYERSLDCVHCGLCLSACPTYLATGRETSSPRGRIYLMRGVAEGRIGLEGLLAEEAALCLGCRACESACPSGVQYGAMLEDVREALVESGLRDEPASRLERALLRGLVARRGRLRALVTLAGWAQRLGLDRLGARLLPRRLREGHALLPPVPARSERAPLPAFTPARGERRGQVALLEGCVAAELLAPVNRATVRVLAANGFDVVVPPGQGCCGALHAHAGDRAFARDLARRNAAAFAGSAPDAVLTNSAGCGAALRELELWIGAEGASLAARSRDVCAWLDEVGLRPPARPVPARVCYDDPCHLVHGQGVSGAPRRLLRAVEGLEIVPHDEASACCGAAGTYNLTQPDMARRVLDRKLDALEAAAPDVVATGNPGCLMQLAAGVRRRGLPARVVHPVELLDRAYAGDAQR